MLIKKVRMLFGNMKMYRKLILSYMVVTLIPICLICSFMIKSSVDLVTQETNRINEMTYNQTKSNIHDELRHQIDVANSVLYDKQIMSYLEAEYNEQYDLNATKLSDYDRIKTLYTNEFIMKNNNQISMHFYTTNTNILNDSKYIILTDQTIKNAEWYRSILEGKGNNIIRKTHINEEGNLSFSIGRVLLSPTNTKYTNVIVLEVTESSLFKFIDKESKDKEIYIVDDTNTIISSTERSSVGKNINEVSKESLLNQNKSKYFMKSDTFRDKTILNDWRVIYIASSKNLNYKINNIIKQSILLCSLVFIISSIFIILFSNTMTKRLKILVKNMAEIKDGNFNVFASSEYEDEIGVLSRSFKSMIGRINTLISEVYLANIKARSLSIEKKEAEIHALQSQINPHFMFNTMESIRMNLIVKKDTETAKIVESYANLLRESIEWREDEITLRQELEFITYYINIQKFRYRDKLNFQFIIDENLNNNLLLKFTIQPLVENSIYHGIEMKSGKGNLKIIVSELRGNMNICVEDDGLGMTEEEVNVFKNRLISEKVKERGKIGVRNVDRRIKLFYGEEYGVHIKSVKNQGTKIYIELPLKVRGAENNV